MTLKLRPKQLAQINQLQQQKQQLNQLLQDLNIREGAFIELILEEHGVIEPVSNIRLENDSLLLEIKEPEKA